ncbi:MAG: type III pantothenate kinase [bacterium]
MNLVVDVGNSLIKVSIFDNEDLIEHKVFDDENIPDLENFCSSGSVDNAIMSSVREEKVIDLSKIKGIKKLINFSYNTPTPLSVNYDTPETLGTDRIAAAVGGSSLFPGDNVLTIIAGTCITYEFSDKNNEYCGGAISPGMMMRFKALNNFTAKLPLISKSNLKLPELLTAKNTVDSILSGVINGIVYEIDGVIAEYIKKYASLKIVLSGGDAFYFDKMLKNKIFVTQNLVSYGLNKILIYNVQKH